jgi:hypothetical protein
MVLNLVQAGRTWKSQIGALTEAGLQVVPLDSGGLMAQEAHAMGSGLAARIAECRAGNERYFSIRDEASGARLAVLGLERRPDGRWTPIDLKGPANAEVGDFLVRLLASVVAGRYDRADREAAAPEAIPA